ncbi:MAG: hypothetical protein ACKVSF_11730 [Alphaproteobacteria bacterium]
MADALITSSPLRMSEGTDPLARVEPPEGYRRMKLWAGDEFSFADILDFINPLQHIPVVSTIYRQLTGDKIGALAQLTMGGILGGPIGLIGAVANVAMETESGKSLEQAASSALGLNLFGGENADEVAERSPADRPANATVTASGPDRADGIERDVNSLAAVIAEATVAPQPSESVRSGARQAEPSASRVDSAGRTPLARKASSLASEAAIGPSARQALAGRGGMPVALGRFDPIAAALGAQNRSGNPNLPLSMMQALDKYEALARQKPEVARQIDQSN